MDTMISVLVLLACGAIVIFMTGILVIDMAGRVDYLKSKFPSLLRWSERREWHGILLLVCLFLLLGNLYELDKKETAQLVLPPIMLPSIPAPKVAEVKREKHKESRNSLRNRTFQMANELYGFLLERYQHRPPNAIPVPSNQPPPDEETARKIKACQDWDQETHNIYIKKYKDRAVGIIKEYETKGIPTGYMEINFVRNPPQIPIEGTVVTPGSPYDELGEFRSLGYRVDANDVVIYH